uniref:Protein tyrosine phosphatase n=1 Tax=Panagrolaimus sp. ES5 TaxID=591445 RepID=A0AC34FJC3_9BILA
MATNENHVALNQRELFLNALQNIKIDQYQQEWKKQQAQDEKRPPPATEFERELLKPENMATNRYDEIPCNDFNRVTLNGNKYIHGNFIKGANGQKLAIATQGPLKTTIYDFWSMAIQEKSPAVVMLCKCNEDKEKCTGYWPTATNFPTRTKNYTIYADSIQEIIFIIEGKPERIIKTHIRITDRYGKQAVHKMVHYQYVDWEDHAVPTSTRPLMHLYKQYILPQMKKEGGPIIVHCSAGIGRTGVFVGALYMLDLFLHNRLVSMSLALSSLRHQRGKAVQGLKQYTFLHILLFELIEHSTGKDLKTLKERFEKILLKIKSNVKK